MELSRARIDRLGEAIKSGELNDVDQSVFNYLRSRWAELGNEISKKLILEFGNFVVTPIDFQINCMNQTHINIGALGRTRTANPLIRSQVSHEYWCWWCL